MVNRQAEQAKDRARKLLHHYFELFATNAGVKWTRDNVAEVDQLVDDLVAAATPGPSAHHAAVQELLDEGKPRLELADDRLAPGTPDPRD